MSSDSETDNFSPEDAKYATVSASMKIKKSFPIIRKKLKKLGNIDETSKYHSASSVDVTTTRSLSQDPKQNRRSHINGYEQPRSDRESWWRSTIRETPLPGAYNVHLSTFIHEINKKPMTYSFKSDGRRVDPLPQQGKGEYLLPGAYGYEDFNQRLKKIQMTYGFKNRLKREKKKYEMGPEADLSPFSYDTNKYLAIESGYEPVRHSFFKSKDKRNIFQPKTGPSPGEYEASREKIPAKEITSCFKSESARFGKDHTITPGPGAYEPISAWINSKQSQNFNSKGVYFTTSAKVLT